MPKGIDDMTEPELQDLFRLVAQRVEATLPPDTGFIVLATTFSGKVAQYVSNVQRADAFLSATSGRIL